MKIGIIGLGLIGGSLAIELRQLGHTILGVSRNPHTCQQAIARQITHEASPDLQILTPAEVIFLCTPLGSILPTVQALIPHLAPTTILTDVGSVKTPIVQAITPLWHNFIGGHPMAGTAESGLDAALAGLFIDRPYVLTPTDTTPPEAIATLTHLTQSLQSKTYQCRPEDHDRAVALISHLPVMISANLITTCTAEPTVLELAQKLASSGFQDTSRVGGGNPELGVMMAKYNQPELLRSLHTYRHQLDQLIQHIEQQNWTELENILTQTQHDRPPFLIP
jgi:arogenate dehydrogenase (NADP+)